jgi:hypothetical protein
VNPLKTVNDLVTSLMGANDYWLQLTLKTHRLLDLLLTTYIPYPQLG